MSNPLASMCPCGHAAFHHPTPEQQAMQLKRTGGRYAGECKGGTSSHCRCITDRQQVIAAADTDPSPWPLPAPPATSGGTALP